MKVRLQRTADLHDVIDRALDALGIDAGEAFLLTTLGTDYTPDGIDDDYVVLGAAPTSKSAAERVFPTTGTTRYKVIHALIWGPATRDELVERTGIQPNTLRPRVLEALDGGWIQQCVDTPIRNGLEVLELTTLGITALEDTI